MENNDNGLKENIRNMTPEQIAELKVESTEILRRTKELLEECDVILDY